ncbi:MAG: phosphatase PAP2 family protein, partial [Bacteroidota bacterium]
HIIFFLIFSGCIITLFAQEDTAFVPVRLNKEYAFSYITDTRDLLISPTRWNGKEWVTFAGLTGTTVLLMQYDEKIQDWAQENRSEFSDTLSKYALEPWGSGMYSMPVLGLFYVQGCLFHNDRSKRVAMLGVKSFLLSGAMVQIPKYLFNRHRPYHDDPRNAFNFDGPFTGDYYKSFFSGHTTSVFAVATVVATEYRDKPIIPVICYSVAGLSALSRINDNKHWASDVLCGALYGYAIGRLIYFRNNWGIKINPWLAGDNKGLTLNITLK